MHAKAPKDIFILSIDGGGIFGMIPLLILHHIEKQTGRAIGNLFHFLVGTSTGGLIVLGLTCPSPHDKKKPQHTAMDLLNLYTHHAQKIFTCTPLGKMCQKISLTRWFYNAFYPQYSSDPMAQAFKEVFGTQTLSQCIQPVLVPAYAIGGRCVTQAGLKLFTSHEGQGPHNLLPKTRKDFYLADVAMATSAVPTYFAPKWISPVGLHHDKPEDYCLIDGGVAVNDPTLLAYVEAQKLFPRSNINILSLSGGQESSPYHVLQAGYKTGYLAWRKDISKLIIGPSVGTQQKILHSLLKQCAQTANFLRIQSQTSLWNFQWDAYDEHHIQGLHQGAHHLIHEHYKGALENFMTKMLLCHSLQESLAQQPCGDGVDSALVQGCLPQEFTRKNVS